MKKLVIVLLVLVALAAAGYFALVALLDPEAQRAALEQRLEKAFGQDVTVGPLKVKVLPAFGVEAKGVKVQMDPAFGEGNVLEIDRVFANVGFWAYAVDRTPVLDRLTLEGTKLRLVKRADGVWNFTTLGAAAGAQRTADARAAALAGRGGVRFLLAALPSVTALQAPKVTVDPTKLAVRAIEAKNVELTLVNRGTAPETETVYKGIELAASVEPSGDEMSLKGRLSADSAAAGGEPLAIDLPFDALLTPPAQAGRTWLAQGSVANGRFATRNFAVEAVSTSMQFDEGQVLHLDPLNVTLYGGTLEGNFNLDLATPGNHFTTETRMNSVALEGLLASRPDFAGSVTGKATTEFKGEGDLGDFSYTLQTLSGGGRVTLADVRLTTVNVMAEIAAKGGFEGLQFDGQGTHVDEIQSDFQAKGGRLQLSNATVKGIDGYADARVRAGSIALASPATAEMTGDVTILPPLFEKARTGNSTASLILTILGSKGSVTVPLVVSGPLTQPAVSVDWMAVLRQQMGFGFF